MSTASEYADTLPFALDAFQREALEAVQAGESALVAAPTGSGKTVVAEFACWLAMRTGGKCFYTTPIKALSNQKFADLGEQHGTDNVGLLTGDNSINGEAPLVVMTTEVLRNMLYERSSTLQGLRYVVLDEVHYLQDPYRGAVWEEVLIHLPEEVRVVCLSATISNDEDFGAWIRTLRGPTRVVVERKRPVELHNLVMAGERLYPLLGGRRRVNEELARAWTEGVQSHAARRGRHRRPGTRHVAPKVYAPTRVEVAETLERESMLPAIVFIFSRAGCDEAVGACVRAGIDLTTRAQREEIRAFATERAADLGDEDLRALRFASFVDGLERGIAAHHAGMLPVFKETVEQLFKRGDVRLVFATETLALGINMPARSVVIERLSKFTGEKHELLTPTEYTQLTGRAGRRGIDELGYGVTLFSPWVSIDKVTSLATRRSYELRSSFRLSYNMATNLVRNHDPETARHVLNSSFAQFTVDAEVVRLEQEVTAKEREAAALEAEMTCERGDIASYARLRVDVERARKATRGSREVREAFARLGPGQVLWSQGIGRAVVLEQPRLGKGGKPQATVMTRDRKLRQITPRDFRTPPEPVAELRVRGQSWRSSKVRRDLAKKLSALDVKRPDAPMSAKRAAELQRTYEQHPCHGCPDVDRHIAAAKRHEELGSELRSSRKRVRRRQGSIARSFERVLGVLRDLDYVHDWSLTEDGEMLARVYNESDLLVVECLRRGWLSGLEAADLAAVCSLFTYESRGRDEPEGPPSPQLTREERRVSELYATLASREAEAGVELLKEPDAGFMAQCHEWANGATLEQVLEDRDTSPGDFVRATKQLIDLLQQLRQVVEDRQLADTLGRSVDAIQRGVMAYAPVG